MSLLSISLLVPTDIADNSKYIQNIVKVLEEDVCRSLQRVVIKVVEDCCFGRGCFVDPCRGW